MIDKGITTRHIRSGEQPETRSRLKLIFHECYDLHYIAPQFVLPIRKKSLVLENNEGLSEEETCTVSVTLYFRTRKVLEVEEQHMKHISKRGSYASTIRNTDQTRGYLNLIRMAEHG